MINLSWLFTACVVVVMFLATHCETAVVSSISLVQSYEAGVLTRTKRVVIDWYKCGRPGGEKALISVSTPYGTCPLEIMCLPPLHFLDRTVYSIVPEAVHILTYENSMTPTITTGMSQTDSVMGSEFSAALGTEEEIDFLGRRLLALPDDPPIVKCKNGICTQSAITSRVECFEASFNFLEDLRVNQPSRYPSAILGPRISITFWPATIEERRLTYWYWWNSSISDPFPEQQLVTTLAYQNAVPSAFCEADVFNGYNATALEEAILNNQSIAYSQTFIDPQASECIPEGFQWVMNTTHRADLRQRLVAEIARLTSGPPSTSSPSPLEEYTLLLEHLDDPDNVNVTYMVAQEFLSDNLFFYDGFIGLFFRDVVRDSLIHASGKDGYDIRRDVKYSTQFSVGGSEALPRLRPGDFFECANNGCKCTLNKYGDQFRTCTLNIFELTSKVTGLVPDQRTGFVQKCFRLKKKWLQGALLHPSLVRDRGLTTKTKYCGEVGSKATSNTIKMETEDYLTMAAGTAIGWYLCGPKCAVAGLAVGAAVVGVQKAVDYFNDIPCRNSYLTQTDQTQRVLDTQVTEAAIASGAQGLLSWLQGGAGTYIDENGVEMPFNLEGILALVHRQAMEVNNLTSILNNQTDAILSLSILLTKLGLDTTQDANKLQKQIDELIAIASQEHEAINEDETVVTSSVDYLLGLLNSTIVSSNATREVVRAMLLLQNDMMKNHSLNFKAFTTIDKRTGDLMRLLISNLINEVTQRNIQETFITKFGYLLKSNFQTTGMLPFVVGARPGNSTFGVSPRQLTSAEKIILVDNMRVYFVTEAFENVSAMSNTTLNITDSADVLGDNVFANYSIRTGNWSRLHQYSITYRCNLNYIKTIMVDQLDSTHVFNSIGEQNCLLGAHTANQCKCRMQLTHRQCDVNMAATNLMAAMQTTATNASGNASSPLDFPFAYDMNTNAFAQANVCDNSNNSTRVTVSDLDSGSAIEFEAFIRNMCQGRKLDPALLNLSDVVFPNNSALNVSTSFYKPQEKRLSFDHRLRLPILRLESGGLDNENVSFLIFSQAQDNRVMQKGILPFDSRYCGTYSNEVLSDVSALNPNNVATNVINVTTVTGQIVSLLALSLRRAASSNLVAELLFEQRGDLPRAGITTQFYRKGPSYTESQEAPFAEASRSDLNLVNNATLDDPENFNSVYEYEYNQEMERRYQNSVFAQSLLVNTSDPGNTNASIAFSHIDPATGNLVPGFDPLVQNLSRVIKTQRKNVYKGTVAETSTNAAPVIILDHVDVQGRVMLRVPESENINKEAAKYINDLLAQQGIQTIASSNIRIRSPRANLFTRNGKQVLMAGYGGCIWGSDILNPIPCRDAYLDSRLTPSQYEAMISDANFSTSIVGRAYQLYNTDEICTEYSFLGRAGCVNYIQMLVPQLKKARQYNLTMDLVEDGGDPNSTVFGAGLEGFDPLATPDVYDPATLSSERRILMFYFESMMIAAGQDPYQTAPVSPRDTYNAIDAANNLNSYREQVYDLILSDPYNVSKKYTCKRCSSPQVRWATLCEILDSFCFKNLPEDVDLYYNGERNPDRMDQWVFEENNEYTYVSASFDVPESLLIAAVEQQNSECPLDVELKFPFTLESRLQFRPVASNATQLFRLEISADILESCSSTIMWLVIYPNASEIVKTVPIGDCKFTEISLYREFAFPNATIENVTQVPLLCFQIQSSGTDLSLEPGAEEFQQFSEVTVDELRVKLASLGLKRSTFVGEVQQITVETYRAFYPYGDSQLTNLGFPIDASVPLFSEINATSNNTVVTPANNDPIFNGTNNSIPVNPPGTLNTSTEVTEGVNNSYSGLGSGGNHSNATNTTLTDNQRSLADLLRAHLATLRNLKNKTQANSDKIRQIQDKQRQLVSANTPEVNRLLFNADVLSTIKVNNSRAIFMARDTLLGQVTPEFWAEAAAMGNADIIDNNATRQGKLILKRKEMEHKRKIVDAMRKRCKPCLYNLYTDDCRHSREGLFILWLTPICIFMFFAQFGVYMLVKFCTRDSHKCRCLVEDGFAKEPKGAPTPAAAASPPTGAIAPAPTHNALYEGIHQAASTANNSSVVTRQRGSHRYQQISTSD